MKRWLVTPELVNEMQRLEKLGVPRHKIAEQLNLSKATVTRHLGPVRSYRGLRMEYQ